MKTTELRRTATRFAYYVRAHRHVAHIGPKTLEAFTLAARTPGWPGWRGSTRPTVPDLVPAVRAHRLNRHRMGCCLHVVLYDGNTAPYFVLWSIREAYLLGHDDCRDLTAALVLMTRTQIAKLGRYYCRLST